MEQEDERGEGISEAYPPADSDLESEAEAGAEAGAVVEQGVVTNGSAPLVEDEGEEHEPLAPQPAANGANRSPQSAMDLAREVVLDADTGDIVEEDPLSDLEPDVAVYGGAPPAAAPASPVATATATTTTTTPAAAEPTSPASLQDLAFIRQRHHAAYQERELATAKREQELADQEMAEKVAKEEELARKRQLEEDEELSRQLAQQLNPTTPSSFSPYQPQSYVRTAVETFSMDDGEIDDQYHQMEDGEVRRPMRTNYLDQLIPSGGPAHGHGPSHGGLQVGTEMVTFPPLLNEYGDPREVGASFSMARSLPRSPLLTALVPIGCTVITVGVAGVVAMSWLSS